MFGSICRITIGVVIGALVLLATVAIINVVAVASLLFSHTV